MSDVAVQAHGIGKRYRIGEAATHSIREAAGRLFPRAMSRVRRASTDADTVWALRNVSFELRRGETLGIVGLNGAGKSTLLKILSRITEPTEGYAAVHGRVAALLEVGTGFHPDLTGRENVFLNGAILGMRRPEIQRRFDEIVDFAGVERFIDTPIRHYSSGMQMRLAFSVAAHLEPEILFIDEVLAVGDVAFQQKCLGRMSEVAGQGRTVVFVSHNMAAIRTLCKRGIWLDGGQIGAQGSSADCIDAYLRSFEASTASDRGTFDVTRRADRTGNGKVRITEVRFLGPVGNSQDSFEFGEPLAVEISIVAEDDVPPAFVGFTVVSSDGSSVFSSHHTDSAERWALIGGMAYTLRCGISPNQLGPGRYFLQAGVADYSTWESYDWFFTLATFTIEPGTGRYCPPPDGRPGYLHPIFKWIWETGPTPAHNASAPRGAIASTSAWQTERSMATVADLEETDSR